jgi:hypothetical protein
LGGILGAVPNLVLVHNRSPETRADFEQIAARIRQRNRDVHVFVKRRPKRGRSRPALRAAFRPTLVVSPLFLHEPFFLRGRVCEGWRFDSKLRQYELLAKADVAVPRWTRITPETRLDPEEWGPYVVIKPDIGARGANVKIKRTGRVRYAPYEELREAPEDGGGLLAQRFVYTGRWPASYRVLTLFGEPLVSFRCEGNGAGYEPLETPKGFGGGGISIVSNRKTSEYRLSAEPDVLALARRAHAAISGPPLLGTDIVRDAAAGDLFVLECNPSGRVNALSGPSGRKIQQDHGLDFYGQFGALDVAAGVLAERTRALAV